MLKPPASIKKPSEIKEVFKKGKRLTSGNLAMLRFPSKKVQLLVVVSKKYGNAVARNRARRIIKEFFRLNMANMVPGKFIIIPKAPLVNNYYDTSNKMLMMMKKQGIDK